MMTADLIIHGGKVVSPDSVVEASVAIKDGRIVSVGAAETMPVGAATLIGRINVDWGAMSAAWVIGALPIVLFAILVQKHLVRGLTVGAVK